MIYTFIIYDLILKNGKMLISEKVSRKTYRNENNLTNYF